MSEIEKIIQSLDEIPSMPSSTMKIMNMVENEKSSAGDLAKIINMDQGLTSKVLRLTNSPFYGLATKVASVKQAVALLGFQKIKNIALSTEFAKSINQAFDGYLMGRGELWKHSIACGVIAAKLAHKKDKLLADVAFTAGMVHDIGRTLLSRLHLSAFSQVKDMAKSENISFNEAERKIFGMCHAEAGGKLAEKWKFPPALVDAIKFHHEPRKSFQGRKLACIIHVADIITINGGVGVGGDGLRYQLDESSLKLLNIQEADFDQLILELHTGMKSIDDFVANSS